jgi:plastocyanin
MAFVSTETTLEAAMKTLRWVLFVVLVLAFVALAGCSSTTSTTSKTPTSSAGGAGASRPGGSAGSGSDSVGISNFAFDPADLTVKVGAKVTWTNHDSVQHTVTADGGGFDSGPIGQGATFSFTFAKAGTYKYHCAVHPQMTGQITVQ